MLSLKNQYDIWSSRPTLVGGASWSLPSSRIQTPTSLLCITMIRTIRLTWNSKQWPHVENVENTCKRKVVLEGLYLEAPQQNLPENDSERPECPAVSCKLQVIFIILVITIIAAIIIINIIIARKWLKGSKVSLKFRQNLNLVPKPTIAIRVFFSFLYFFYKRHVCISESGKIRIFNSSKKSCHQMWLGQRVREYEICKHLCHVCTH